MSNEAVSPMQVIVCMVSKKREIVTVSIVHIVSVGDKGVSPMSQSL